MVDRAERPRSIQLGRLSLGSGPDTSAVARGLREAESVADQALQRSIRLRDQSYVSSQTAAYRKSMAETAEEIVNSAPETGDGMGEGFLNARSKWEEESLSMAPSADARARLQASFDSLGTTMQLRMEAQQAARRASFHVKQAGESVQLNANVLASDPSQFNAALEEMHQMMDTFAEGGTVPKDDLEQARSQFMGILAEAAVEGMIAQDPGAAVEALNAGEFDNELTRTGSKTAKLNRARAATQALEARAQRMADARERAAAKMVDQTISRFLSLGEVPQDMAERTQSVADTDAAAKLDLWAALAPQIKSFRQSPATVRNLVLAEARQRADTDDGFEQLRALEKVSAQLSARVSRDALSAYTAESGITLGQLVVQGENGLSLDPEELEARAVAANEASVWAGRDVAVFTRPEMDQLVEMISSSDTALGDLALAQMLEPLEPRQLKQVASELGTDSGSLAVAIHMYSDRPVVAASILRGEKLLRSTVVKVPSDFDGAIGSYFAEAFLTGGGAENQAAFVAVKRAVLARYADRMTQEAPGEIADDEINSDIFEAAVRDVVTIHDFNGNATLAPLTGLSEEAFEAGMDALTDDDLQAFGRLYNPQTDTLEAMTSPPLEGHTGDRLTAETLLDEAVLHAVGPGQYRVFLNNGYARNPFDPSREYILDLGEFFSERRPR